MKRAEISPAEAGDRIAIRELVEASFNYLSTAFVSPDRWERLRALSGLF